MDRMSYPEKEEGQFIYQRCKMCEGDEVLHWGEDSRLRKFMVCEDGFHAICCDCTYRIQVPQNKLNKEVKQKWES